MLPRLPGLRKYWTSRVSHGVGLVLLWPVALAVVLVSLITSLSPQTVSAPAPLPSQAHSPALPHTSPSPRPPVELSMLRAEPLRLQIPQLQIDAPFTDLEIGSSGALDAPPADDVNLVGWFADGPSPGERGTSVVAGHVDTATSPAVFAELSELDTNSRFNIHRDDGTTATFRVDSVETFPKDDFPNDRVYKNTPDAQIRLITCAGDYDRSAKDYTENLVVFAHLAATS
ncbi:class F sortase [Streptomyces sp. NPDC001822]|uniref:class F sortase n=1 Tax=Streptomyces sp. NPDC001822 TaxID=3364614 RepID=UPI0036911D92